MILNSNMHMYMYIGVVIVVMIKNYMEMIFKFFLITFGNFDQCFTLIILKMKLTYTIYILGLLTVIIVF